MTQLSYSSALLFFFITKPHYFEINVKHNSAKRTS